MGNDASHSLSPTEIHDLKKETTFSQHEIREWYSKFHGDCPSGQMTEDQFKTMYSQIFPKGDAKQFAEHVFRVYDKDGNGTIDFREFICTISIAQRGSIDEKLRWAFNMYDIDGNGYVTKKECREIFKAISKMRGGKLGSCDWDIDPDSAVEQLFVHLDRDRDERLSDMEFILGAKATPSVLAILESEQTVE